MLFDFDAELAERYGVFASYCTSASPSEIEYYGEDSAAEFDRLLDRYVTPASQVLDIGCGAGFTLCRLAPQVEHIWGMDQNMDLLRAAELRAQHLHLTNASFLSGSTYDPLTLQNIPDSTFHVAFSRRGPNISEPMLRTLRLDAIFVQEVVSNLDGYPLGEIFGRRDYTAHIYRDQDVLLNEYANMGLVPVSCKEYFYEEYFRDNEHLAVFLTQVQVMLTPWLLPRSLPRKPFDSVIDRNALELYAHYHTTSRGIRVLRQRKILVLRKNQ